MKRVLEFIDYFTAAANAISKGCKVIVDHWPVNSPFGNRTDSNTDGTKE